LTMELASNARMIGSMSSPANIGHALTLCRIPREEKKSPKFIMTGTIRRGAIVVWAKGVSVIRLADAYSISIKSYGMKTGEKINTTL